MDNRRRDAHLDAEGMDHHDDLPEILGRLTGDITTYIEAKLGLLKLELEIRLRSHARRALTYAAGACLGLTAFLIASLAMAFGVSALLRGAIANADARRAAAFAIVAGLELTAAAVLLWAARRTVAIPTTHPTEAPSDGPAESALLLRTRKSP